MRYFVASAVLLTLVGCGALKGFVATPEGEAAATGLVGVVDGLSTAAASGAYGPQLALLGTVGLGVTSWLAGRGIVRRVRNGDKGKIIGEPDPK